MRTYGTLFTVSSALVATVSKLPDLNRPCRYTVACGVGSMVQYEHYHSSKPYGKTPWKRQNGCEQDIGFDN